MVDCNLCGFGKYLGCGCRNADKEIARRLDKIIKLLEEIEY